MCKPYRADERVAMLGPLQTGADVNQPQQKLLRALVVLISPEDFTKDIHARQSPRVIGSEDASQSIDHALLQFLCHLPSIGRERTAERISHQSSCEISHC